MNRGLVRKTLGRILFIEAILMIIPALLAIFYKEGIRNINSFTITIAILLMVSIPMMRTETYGASFTAKDGYIIVSLSWLALSFFGAFPYYISNQIPIFASAIFESVSGFTTTGASTLVNTELFTNSMHFWRSLTQFIGGMGIIVFVLAFMKSGTKGSLNIMKAEVPGPEVGKVVSKVGPSAKILYTTYIVLTVSIALLLLIAGLSPFDALIHAMGTTSTGSFSNKNASIGHYNNPWVELIITIGMFLSSINFNIYFLIIIGRARQVLESEELRFYIRNIIFAVSLIAIISINLSSNILVQLKEIIFSVVSIASTTGYTITDYTEWPLGAQIILMAMFFIGGCTGSTAGGLKSSRALALLKSGIRFIKKSINPRRVIIISDSKNYVSDDRLESAQSYLVIYIIAFIIILFLLSLNIDDFDTSFSMTLAALSNNAPSFAGVGPGINFYEFSAYSKIVLSLAMIVGRLEIIPVILLLSPGTYERR